MKTLTISIQIQKEIRNIYETNFKNKNWGSWNINLMPSLNVGYSLLQYENDKGQTCDVIKFDKSVILENKKFSGSKFQLSKYKPNHKIDGEWYRDLPEVTIRRCHICEKYFPVDSDIWATSRKCNNCFNELENNLKKLFSEKKETNGDNETNKNYWIHFAMHHAGANNMNNNELSLIWNRS